MRSALFTHPRRAVAALLAAAALGAVACGASSSAAPPAAPASSVEKETPDASTGAATAAPAEVEHPFAGSASEAVDLIGAAVDDRSDELRKCVRAYRHRKHLAHERVEIRVGIDQEGRLLGVTLRKGERDPELSACVQQALAGAPFPRSHAGVITITKTFEKRVQ